MDPPGATEMPVKHPRLRDCGKGMRRAKDPCWQTWSWDARGIKAMLEKDSAAQFFQEHRVLPSR